MENFKLIDKKKDTSEEYHSNTEYISSSLLKKYISPNGCPSRFFYETLNKKEPTRTMIIGSAYHTLILEPELFENNYFILDESQRPFPDKDYRTKANQEWKVMMGANNAHKITLTSTEYENLLGMQNVLKSNKKAMFLCSGENKEESYYVELNGVKVKIRPDNLKPKCCVDIKTCEDASPDGFKRQAYQFGYHISAALYTDVLALISGNEIPFIFIAQEKEPPYLISIFKADEGFLAQGRLEYEQALRLHKHCLEVRNFPGYEINNENWRGVFDLSLPGYAFRDIKLQL